MKNPNRYQPKKKDGYQIPERWRERPDLKLQWMLETKIRLRNIPVEKLTQEEFTD
jgi:hypothetical protein